MPNIILMTNNYTNHDAVSNLVNYIVCSDYFEHWGAFGCFILPNTEYAPAVENAFHAVMNANDKADDKQVLHMIIGFKDLPNITEMQVSSVAYAVTSLLASEGHGDYQYNHPSNFYIGSPRWIY